MYVCARTYVRIYMYVHMCCLYAIFRWSFSTPIPQCVCVCACVHACMRECMCVLTCVCVCVCVRMCMHTYTYVHTYMFYVYTRLLPRPSLRCKMVGGRVWISDCVHTYICVHFNSTNHYLLIISCACAGMQSTSA